MSMHVDIVTPARIAYSGEASAVSVPGLLGEFGARTDHAQMLSVTRAGVVSVTDESGTKEMIVGPGFAEVGSERVTLLVDLCEPIGTVDAAQAKQDLAAAAAKLGESDTNSEAGMQAQKQMDLAMARLRS